MDSGEQRELGSALTAQCDRIVRVADGQFGEIRLVLEPTGDRGRVDIVATGDGTRWTLTDRGALHALYGLDLGCVVAKLSEFDAALTRRGHELVADTDDRTLAEAVVAFVDTIEFVPVLVGLFENDRAA